jgi:hypothetical protein
MSTNNRIFHKKVEINALLVANKDIVMDACTPFQ